MIGVDILSSSEVGCNPEPMWDLALIVGGTVLFIIIIMGIIALCRHGDFKDFAAFTVLGLVGGFMFFVMTFEITGDFNYTDTKTLYKVTISEEVTLVEFNEKYEIIDQEGKIYTIVEKEK